jgi:hypothetical protein
MCTPDPSPRTLSLSMPSTSARNVGTGCALAVPSRRTCACPTCGSGAGRPLPSSAVPDRTGSG